MPAGVGRKGRIGDRVCAAQSASRDRGDFLEPSRETLWGRGLRVSLWRSESERGPCCPPSPSQAVPPPPCLGACPSHRPALGRTGDPLQLKANTGRAISFHPSELPGRAGSVAGGRGGRRGAAPSVPPSAANASSGRAWDASFWLPARPQHRLEAGWSCA